MINKLSKIFRSDEFVSSVVIFPNIDRERLARELELEAVGRARGRQNQPETSSRTMDHVELDAVSRVGQLRTKGLENFETNRRVYSERLNSVESARMLVETEANDAKARFAEEVTAWRQDMVNPRERVEEAYAWRTKFRKIHGLERPAKPATSWGNIIGLGLLIILLESAGNAYLFSQNNPLGMLGGLMAAFLISFGNVAMSTIMGMGVHFVNMKGARNIPKKLFGALVALAWVAFALGYNAAVAHFRDAVETTLEWREAGELAIESLSSHPVVLNTMESYVLFLLGFFISIISILKGYNTSDPYPGYSRVSQDVINARNSYVGQLEDLIGTLAEHRDEAVESLRDARDEVAGQVQDSVDALYGQKALDANLSPFLAECDVVANYLLSVYRDANKAAREDDPPDYFQETYAFDAFTLPVTEDEGADERLRAKAEEQARELSKTVETSIREIFADFHDAIQDHYEIDALEGKYMGRAGKYAPVALPATKPDEPETVALQKGYS
ncbi:MAG: hypothetical protein GDA39_05350 [Hyphomonadaceae bacterium]|nr:hypothetical protein [Hyphomonadaceae bacterium]MBC6412336.1 hypothetical protein [Hyphomonadaceae bacterium]